MSAGVVIAGGGLAAQRSAEALRRGGYEGRVRIVSNELHAPYDRPPLSKDFLSGEREIDDLLLRPADWHGSNDVELVLGDAAAGIDVEGRRLLLESGRALDFEHLVIATGSRPRPLPGSEGYTNVFTLRSLDDSLALREVLRPGARLAVLGAGLIGQEVAATASKAGVDVTLIEAEPLPLARALHPELAAWIVAMQREEGVDVLLDTKVEQLVGDGDTLEALVLSDGTRLELDALLVSIGIVPATEWVGADVHELCAHPNFHLAGDAGGGNHWEQATHSGRAVANAILGKDPVGHARHDLVERRARRPHPGPRRPRRLRRPGGRRGPRGPLVHRRRLPRRHPRRRHGGGTSARRATVAQTADRRPDTHPGGFMTLVPTIDDGACAAHGDCVEIAPTVFILEGDVAEVIGTASDEIILAAAEGCPSVAIIVTDSTSGEQIYP